MIAIEVEPQDVAGQCLRTGRTMRTLVGAGSDDDITSLQVAVRGPRHEPSGSAFLERANRHALPQRRTGPVRVALEECDDLIAWHEAIGLVTVVHGVRQLHRPVRRHQAEAVPSVSPGLRNPAALEHDMVHPVSCQLVADGQARLATTDDEGSDLLRGATHVGAPKVRTSQAAWASLAWVNTEPGCSSRPK